VVLLKMGDFVAYDGINFALIQILQKIVGQLDITGGVGESVGETRAFGGEDIDLIQFGASFFRDGEGAVTKIA